MACIQAFQRHRHDLAVVIDHLLSYMTCKDLLPESTKERVQLPSLSRMERSVLVLDAIEARIMDNPGIFHTFITVLQKDTVLQKFAGNLIESYRKYLNYGIWGLFVLLLHWYLRIGSTSPVCRCRTYLR